MPDARSTKWRPSIGMIACILLFSCAKQGFPPGGPEDKTPPVVMKTQPGQRETGVNPNTPVTLWFSEEVQTKTSGDAVFISPYQGDNVRLKWRGNRLKIVFLKPLPENTTYVITLGTAIQDYRNNRLANSFSLAFSTGNVLDEGEASGRVVSASSAAGLDVWAYKCDGRMDPDPSRQEPDYIVQCSERGEFRFLNIAPVRYRLFAVRDRAADRLYAPGEDEIGVPYRDAVPGLDGSLHADSLFFKMRREEAGPPSLAAVTAQDRSHLSLRFDRMLSPRVPPSPSLCAIREQDRPSDSLEVKALYLNRENARELIALTANQTDGTAYTLRLRTDWIENAPDSLQWERVLRGSGQPDTARPKLVLIHPKPRERYFNPLDSLRLVFNEVMDTSGFTLGFALLDSSKKAVPGILKWPDPAEVLFIPGEPLANYRDYSACLSGIFDAAGNALSDSTVFFRTSTTDTLSEIGGTVRQAGGSAETGTFVFTASQVGNKEVIETRTVPSPGVYRIPNCLPGAYVLECFRDLDGNGRYSFGTAFPFKPSEPFVVYKDTVKVRSRWPNEGNDLVLP